MHYFILHKIKWYINIDIDDKDYICLFNVIILIHIISN